MSETQVPTGSGRGPWVDRERGLAAQPEAADDGAIGLLGKLAGFHAERLAADLSFVGD